MFKYYKFIFTLLFCVAFSGTVWGQYTPIEFIKGTTTISFSCNKATPVDLFKAMDLFVSPENGYWGDIYGAPYNGKQSIVEDIKERLFTNNNIFHANLADTGDYKFYFYVTSAKGYCGIETSTRIVLDLKLHKGPCLDPVSVDSLRKEYVFCYDTKLELNTQATYDVMTMDELLFSRQLNPLLWKTDTTNINSPWLKIDVYADSFHTERLGGNEFLVSTKPDDSSIDNSVTYYIVIQLSDGSKVDHKVEFTVFRKNSLEVYYSPSIDPGREFDVDDEITITVDNESLFTVYNYFLNNKYLNPYYLGGDSSSNEITLNALAFTGVEDFLEIIAKDINRCVVKWSDNVIVNVPFPSAFTPDGDGLNDVFFGGEKFRNREFHLEIFNRWGNRLYYGESGWDGTYKGQNVPPGTYLYVIILKQPDGVSRTVKGTVALIRKGA